MGGGGGTAGVGDEKPAYILHTCSLVPRPSFGCMRNATLCAIQNRSEPG